jgi:uncharacterized heparinase superfamily protein
MLSFELSWEGRPLIVDTGTSTYERGQRRIQERGTAAHNTVQVGTREQSEIWASFRMARRAVVQNVQAREDNLTARIRAFPPRWLHHERNWVFRGEGLDIRDRVIRAHPDEGRPKARLHFHPDVILTGADRSWLADGVRIRFEESHEVKCCEYYFAPAFNQLIPALCLEVEFEDVLLTAVRP